MGDARSHKDRFPCGWGKEKATAKSIQVEVRLKKRRHRSSPSLTVPAAANASDVRAPERDGVKPAVNGSELRLRGFGDRRELVDSRVWRIERIEREAR